MYHLSPVKCQLSPVTCLALRTFYDLLVKTVLMMKSLEVRQKEEETCEHCMAMSQHTTYNHTLQPID